VLLDCDKMAEATILIVEDEAITAGDIQDRLEDFGYEVPAIASSGEGAIKKVEEIKPDLVLMDIVLKGDMDGIEAAEQIRDRFDVPVVYLTAYIDDARLEKTKLTEPYGSIIKPCEDMELRTAIEMALQRHTLEKALRNAEQYWYNSFNSLEDVMLIIDRDYNIENINEIGLKLLGKSKEAVIGQKCYQVISGADRPREECPCMKSLEMKKVESSDRYEERLGKYYAIQASPIFDENGAITKFVDLRRDITERKRVEEALRESGERYRMLFNSSNDAVFVHGPTRRDMPGKIVEVNDIACQKFGYTREELLKLSHLDLIAPEQLEEVPKIREKLLSTGQIIFEITAVTKDGKKFPCEISTHQFEFKGQPTVLSILRDITERKEREEELDAYREHIKLINKILRHDLISDLSVINSALRIHGRTKEEEPLEEASAYVNKSLELINRMGELEIFINSHHGLKRYSVTDILNKVIEKYPDIAFNIDGEGQVLTDESLSSVIDNIIRNAVIHGNTDRIDVNIGETDKYCEIRIADYGVGIPDEVKGKIFEENFVSGETGGTGLGLYIVKKAMENYGGHVHVEDNIPGWAVFVLALRKMR
jgi:PAS domain S-box-containing protein